VKLTVKYLNPVALGLITLYGPIEIGVAVEETEMVRCTPWRKRSEGAEV